MLYRILQQYYIDSYWNNDLSVFFFQKSGASDQSDSDEEYVPYIPLKDRKKMQVYFQQFFFDQGFKKTGGCIL